MRKYLRKFQKSTMRNSVNGHENTAPDYVMVVERARVEITGRDYLSL